MLSAALDAGLEVTALHNHFFWDTPKVMFMHIGGNGEEAQVAGAVGKVFARIAETAGGKGETPRAEIDPAKSTLDPAKIDAILGAKGSLAAGVYKLVMREPELQPVLKALRRAGIAVVAIHHHMTHEEPRVIFLHYWGTGPTEALAKGLRAAFDETREAGPSR